MSDVTPLWPIQAVAQVCDVSSCTIRRWTAAGMFPPPLRVGPQTLRWDPLQVQGWVSQHRPWVRVEGVDP